MKPFKVILLKLFIGIFFLVITTSCSDFLEEDPENLVATSNYYTTEQDAIAAVNSIYAYLGSYNSGNTAGVYHSTFWVTMGLASDEMMSNQLGTPQFDQLAALNYNADNAAVEEIWRIHYKTISLANIAIDRIPMIEMDEVLKERLIDEAKFLRGLMYFNLVRMFGSVPLLVSEDAPLNPESATVESIYEQIVLDLTDAENLPKDGEITEGRATGGAATALLSKVYLRIQEYELASEKALEVIQEHPYGLWEDFGDIFQLDNRGGKEAIFSVGFGNGGGAISFWEVGQFNVRLLPAELSSQAGITNAQGWQYVTNDIYELFSSEDERREVTFLTEFTATDSSVVRLNRVWVDKYWDRVAEPTAGDSFQDFPVLRLADILLVYAEAQARLGNFTEANNYLNMVRERAELEPVEANNIDEFIDLLLEERGREFVAEGKRWFDLTRLGRLEEAVLEAKGINIDDHYYLFPIPNRERRTNPNLTQNPGY